MGFMNKTNHLKEEADQLREALNRYMLEHGLTIQKWSSDAGLSDTLRHFLTEKNKTMTYATLKALAKAAGTSIDVICGLKPDYQSGKIVDMDLLKKVIIDAEKAGIITDPETKASYITVRYATLLRRTAESDENK